MIYSCLHSLSRTTLKLPVRMLVSEWDKLVRNLVVPFQSRELVIRKYMVRKLLIEIVWKIFDVKMDKYMIANIFKPQTYYILL